MKMTAIKLLKVAAKAAFVELLMIFVEKYEWDPQANFRSEGGIGDEKESRSCRYQGYGCSCERVDYYSKIDKRETMTMEYDSV